MTKGKFAALNKAQPAKAVAALMLWDSCEQTERGLLSGAMSFRLE
jgi:hypothetical protein